VPIEQKTIDELKAKHGELHQLSSPNFTVIVRKPDRQVWRKFCDAIVDERRRVDAVERLFLDCVVYPESAAVNAMLDSKPALAQQFGSEVADLAKDGEVEKKVL
jgi:hypothetical protein